MRIDVHHHFHDVEIPAHDEIVGLLQTILREVRIVSAELDRLALEVSEMQGAIDSAITLITGLGDMIRQIPADRAALNALADSLDAQAAALGAAVAANPLPVEPVPEPVPEPPPAEPVG